MGWLQGVLGSSGQRNSPAVGRGSATVYGAASRFVATCRQSSWLDGVFKGENAMFVRHKVVGAVVALAVTMIAIPAHASGLADPQGSGVIIGAVNWLQGTLLGTVATVAAVIAVAAVGFMMLTGRINWRHGAVVVLGCFILFGAASIVAGIRSAAAGG
jgi:type IV secretory pathway VirB2 component (pilin)